MDTGTFPGVKWSGRYVDNPSHLVPMLKKEENYTSTPSGPSWSFLGCTLPLPLLSSWKGEPCITEVVYIYLYIYSNSPSPAEYPHIFPNFRPFFSLPSSGFPRPSTSRSSHFTYLPTGVTNLWPYPKHGPFHFLSHPYTYKQRGGELPPPPPLRPKLQRHPDIFIFIPLSLQH